MNITFLGTGTSFGIPMVGCQCKVCLSSSVYNKRLRSSILIKENETTLLIDTSPDFRFQALHAKISSLTGVLYTHYHFDHIAGLDDIRAFQCKQKEEKNISLFADRTTCTNLRHRFPYCFEKIQSRYILPQVTLQEIQHFVPFQINSLEILPLPVCHGDETITGYLINRRLAYFSDISLMPKETRSVLKNIDLLVLTALRMRPHKKHFSLHEAVEEAQKIHPRKTYFTHISHMIEHTEGQTLLPPSMHLAYDGLEIDL